MSASKPAGTNFLKYIGTLPDGQVAATYINVTVKQNGKPYECSGSTTFSHTVYTYAAACITYNYCDPENQAGTIVIQNETSSQLGALFSYTNPTAK